MFVVKYTKAQYEAKISELEGYHNQLNEHLARMEDLKSQLFKFWNDSNAQTTGMILAEQIRKVRTAMDRTTDSINMYKSAIENLEGVNFSAGNILSEALKILGD